MKAEVAALAASTIALWGTFGVFGKLAVERVDQQVLLWGSLIAGPIVFLVYLVGSGQLLPINWHASGISFAFLAGLGGCIGTVLFYQLLAREAVSLVVPLTSLYPAVAVVLSVLFLSESLTLARALGVVFALAAVFLLSR